MNPERILVVDDDPEIAELVSSSISHELGWPVQRAYSAPAALDLLKNGASFDLIVSDYVMPGMNGKDFFERLKQDGVRTYFILFTAKPDIDLEAFSGSYFSGAIEKPDLRCLVNKIVALFTGALPAELP